MHNNESALTAYFISNQNDPNKYQYDPNNKTWADNKDNFGYRMLMQMGWKQGGLGVNEQGRTTNLVAKKKLDKRGIGDQSKADDQWREASLQFSSVLDKLNSVFGTQNDLGTNDNEKEEIKKKQKTENLKTDKKQKKKRKKQKETQKKDLSKNSKKIKLETSKKKDTKDTQKPTTNTPTELLEKTSSTFCKNQTEEKDQKPRALFRQKNRIKRPKILSNNVTQSDFNAIFGILPKSQKEEPTDITDSFPFLYNSITTKDYFEEKSITLEGCDRVSFSR